MSFNQIISEYMNSNVQVTTVEEKVERTSWLRKLLAPALGLTLGLGLSLAACGGEEVVTDDGTSDDLKADKAGTSKSCTTNKQCGIGKYCKKAPVITPKYGITPAPPTITPKYGITPAPAPKKGVCTPLEECQSDADCQPDQKCEGADQGQAKSNCPKGAYCILPPPPSAGICMNTCDTTKDCATGETCVKDSNSSCPAGAYCILPPMPSQGVCEIKVYAIMPPLPAK